MLTGHSSHRCDSLGGIFNALMVEIASKEEPPGPSMKTSTPSTVAISSTLKCGLLFDLINDECLLIGFPQISIEGHRAIRYIRIAAVIARRNALISSGIIHG